MSTTLTPHVSSSEEIVNFPQIVEGAADVIALPIAAKYGPVTPQIVNNRLLIDVFTAGEGIKRSDNISLKLAFGLSKVSDLMVCRVTNTDILPGVAVYSSKVEKVYVKDAVIYTSETCTEELDPSASGNESLAFVVYGLSPYESDLNSVRVVNQYKKATPEAEVKFGQLNLKCIGFNETYNFSMNIDDEDGYGDSLYVTNINTLQNKFVIVAYHDVDVAGGTETVYLPYYSNSSVPYTKPDGSDVFVGNLIDCKAFTEGHLKLTVGNDVVESDVTETSSGSGVYKFGDVSSGIGYYVYSDISKPIPVYITIADLPSTPTSPITIQIDAQTTRGAEFKFGKINAYDYNACVELTQGLVSDSASVFINKALDKIAKFRQDIHIKFLYDAGLISKRITAKIESIAEKRHVEIGIFSSPLSCDTNNKLVSFYNGFASVKNTDAGKSSYLYSCCPARMTTEVTGYNELIPYSFYYIKTIFANMSSNMEYAPVFGKQTGLVPGSGISVMLEHSIDDEELSLEDNDINLPQTEKLQRLSANTVIYDQAINSGYLVNNLTFQTPNLNSLSEENNRRLFGKIQFEVNQLLDSYISKANNNITREELENALTTYRISNLDVLGYGLNKDNANNGFRFDITPYNAAKRNTLELTVEVCFNNSIKYIKVLYRSIPVM